MRTILIDLPLKCRGYIYEDVATGDRVCVLNARYSYESNQLSYLHECYHVENGDFDSDDNINAIENRAHNKF